MFYVGKFDGVEIVFLLIVVGCCVYVYVVCGKVSVNGCMLVGGDVVKLM